MHSKLFNHEIANFHLKILQKFCLQKKVKLVIKDQFDSKTKL